MKTLGKKKDLAGQINLSELPAFTVINSEKAIPKKVILIFDEAESSIVGKFVGEYDEKKVIFTKYSDWNKVLKKDILVKADYILFFVSEKSMKNKSIMRLLLKYYKNNKFIAIILDSILLELTGRVEIYKYWREKLDYAKNIIQSGIINKDVCKEYFICEEVIQILGNFFDKAYEDNLLRDRIEDVFDSRLSEDGINDLRNKYSSTDKDGSKHQKGKPVSMERKALDKMNQNNYYAKFMTVNTGGDNARFKSTVNSNEQTEKIYRTMEQIASDIKSLQESDADKISNAIADLSKEMEKGKLEKGKINSILNILASMVTVATGIPNLKEHLKQLIDYVKMLPMH